ncbi:hypothetical protein IAR55_005921 [Kwoniella newhampshirensis]|uniref:Ubiquitin-like protease family profile domain-containing protein n=1 Tax=Kwoniella newhampshirensis TaxID=1651941 RepID=A0AAW0YVP8_9TREE
MEGMNKYEKAPYLKTFLRKTKGESMTETGVQTANPVIDVEDSSDDHGEIVAREMGQVIDTRTQSSKGDRTPNKNTRYNRRINPSQTPYRPGHNTLDGKNDRKELPRAVQATNFYPKRGESSTSVTNDKRLLTNTIKSSRRPLGPPSNGELHPRLEQSTRKGDSGTERSRFSHSQLYTTTTTGTRQASGIEGDVRTVFDVDDEDTHEALKSRQVNKARIEPPMKPDWSDQAVLPSAIEEYVDGQDHEHQPLFASAERTNDGDKGKRRELNPISGSTALDEMQRDEEDEEIVVTVKTDNVPAHRVVSSAREEDIEFVAEGSLLSKGSVETSSPHGRRGLHVGTGLRSSNKMKDRNGVQYAQPQTVGERRSNVFQNSPDRLTSKDTIPSSMLGQKTAEIREAWMWPNHMIRCQDVICRLGDLTLKSEISGIKLWTIPYKDVNIAQICVNEEHPTLFLDLRSISDRNDLDDMLDGVGPRIDSAPGLFLRLTPSHTSAMFLHNYRSLIINTGVAVQVLDEKACETLRDSCNSQMDGDTRTRAEAQRMTRPRETRQKRRSDRDAPEIVLPKASRQEQQQVTRGKRNSKLEDDTSQTKLNFDKAPRRSSRLSETRATPDASKNAAEAAATRGMLTDKNELYFPYPPKGKADVNITHGDAQRLQEGEFLNDTLLEFGLRHVMDQLDEEMRRTVHLFNSFFYDKLSNKSKKSKPSEASWPAYESVKKWTKGKDIFSKSIVVVPINENYHWYLAVIVNPGAALKATSPPEHGSHVRSATLPSQAPVDDVSVPGVTHENNPPASVSAESEVDNLESRSASPRASSTDLNPLDDNVDTADGCDSTMMSHDPIDCIDDSEPEFEAANTTEMQDVEVAVEDMSLDEKENESEKQDSIGTGRPILTPTVIAAQKQQEIFLSGQVPSDETTTVKKKTQQKPDVKIINDSGYTGTWIITFDSLGGAHKSVSRTLNLWLQFEALDKRGVTIPADVAEYWEGRVPQQPNFYDCGLYVVHYARQLLLQPNEVLRFIQRRPPHSAAPERSKYDTHLAEAWNAEETGNLRQQWIDAMAVLASQYTDARDLAYETERQLSTSQSESIAAFSQIPSVEKTDAIPPVLTRESAEQAPYGRADPSLSRHQHEDIDPSVLPETHSLSARPSAPAPAYRGGIAVTPNGRGAIPAGVVDRTRDHFDHAVREIGMGSRTEHTQSLRSTSPVRRRDLSVETQDVNDLDSERHFTTSRSSSPPVGREADRKEVDLATPLRRASTPPHARRYAPVSQSPDRDNPFSSLGNILSGRSVSTSERARTRTSPLIPTSSKVAEPSINPFPGSHVAVSNAGEDPSEEEQEEVERIEDKRPTQPASAWDPIGSLSPVNSSNPSPTASKTTGRLGSFPSKRLDQRTYSKKPQGGHKREGKQGWKEEQRVKRLRTDGRGRGGKPGEGASAHNAIEVDSE